MVFDGVYFLLIVSESTDLGLGGCYRGAPPLLSLEIMDQDGDLGHNLIQGHPGQGPPSVGPQLLNQAGKVRSVIKIKSCQFVQICRFFFQ